MGTPNFAQKIHLQHAASIYRRTKNYEKLAEVQVRLAQLAYDDGEYLRAKHLLPNLERYGRSHPAWQKYLLTKGQIQQQEGWYHSAFQHFNRSRSGPFKNRNDRAQLNANLGEIYRAFGWYRQAESHLRTAISHSSKKITRADAYATLGQLKFNLGQYEEAITAYKQAITLRQIIHRRDGKRNLLELARNRLSLGQVYRALGDRQESQRQYRQSQQVAVAVRNADLEVQFHLQMAELATDQNAWQVAQGHLEQAKVLQGKSSNQIAILISQANLQQRRKALGKALTSYKQALSLAKNHYEPTYQANILARIGAIELAQGNSQQAIATLNASISGYESLRHNLQSMDKVALADRQAQAYQALQQAYVANRQPDKALEIAERGRARSFIELLAARLGAQQRIQPIQPPTLNEIRRLAREKKSTIVTYSSIQNSLTQQESNLYIWVIQPDGSIKFRDIDLQQQAQLPTDLTPRQLALNVRSGQRISIAKVNTDQQQSNSPINTSMRSGYDLLIKPIAQWLPSSETKPVIIVPQGTLFSIPFHALQQDNGQYLLQSHTIKVAPSIQSLTVQDQQTRQPLTAKPLIIGNPSPMPADLIALPGAEREAKTIATLLNTQALTGKQATEQTVREQLSQASLIHLATHGLLDEHQGMASAIALVANQDQDGLLTASELSRIKLQANLAVLSACETGRGKVTGDGIVGLSRSLMLAGVPNVVVSLWAVPDQPTETLMTEFYRQMPQYPDTAQALRQAMLTTMKQHPDPTDWAGFVLMSIDN